MRWTSRYGSLVTTIYGIGIVDGINERGLGAHALYLEATDLGQRLYFFELTTSPNTIWIEFDGLDFTAGSEPRAINPYDDDLTGNVTSKLTPHQSAF